MKKSTLLTILSAGLFLTASAQTKQDSGLVINKKYMTTSAIGAGTLMGSGTLAPHSFVFTGNLPKPVMTIYMKKDGKENWNDWDIMIISIDKNKLRWLNDSTAVYIK